MMVESTVSMNETGSHSDMSNPSSVSYIPSPVITDLNISTSWHFQGTNNSAIQCQAVNHAVPEEFHWGTLTTHGVSQKRHICDSSDDHPPCKVHINEEKVSMQFKALSLQQSSSQRPFFFDPQSSQTNTTEAMWKRFYDLEDKLEVLSDSEVDEGVSMEGDNESNEQLVSAAEGPTLHVSSHIKDKINNTLPQILIPKPCTEIVLWKPSGPDFIRDIVTSSTTSKSATENQAISSVADIMKASRVKKTATRSLSPTTSSLLLVPSIRPETPPPNVKSAAVCEDVAVCFVDERPSHDDSLMDI